MCTGDIFLGLLALLFPPLPVWVKCGICSADSLINILLCCLGFIPGLLHAWYIIARYPDPGYDYEQLSNAEDGRITYIYVQPQPQPQPQSHPHGQQYGATAAAPKSHNPRGPSQPHYGTMNAGSSSAPPDDREGSEGSDGAVPPSYAEAVGDHKVQNRD